MPGRRDAVGAVGRRRRHVVLIPDLVTHHRRQIGVDLSKKERSSVKKKKKQDWRNVQGDWEKQG